MKHYDVIIIGTGAANIVADAALRENKTVALIERGRFGGTCLNRGCIPTKMLVTAANAICEIREARRIGVNAENVTLDWKLLSERLWKKVNESEAIRGYYDRFPTMDTYHGTASFSGKKESNHQPRRRHGGLPHRRPDYHRHRRPHAYSRPAGSCRMRLRHVRNLLWQAYPEAPYKSLIIIGGGPIGCEFAHVFNAAGTHVTIVQHNVRLLPKEDGDISAFMLRQFQNRGIDVRLEPGHHFRPYGRQRKGTDHSQP